MAAPNDEPLTIVILSGATGRTAEQVIKAALAQFDGPNVRIVKKTKVRSVRSALKIINDAAERNAIVCHSLVSSKIRDAILQETKRRMVPNVDILGPVLAVLSDHLQVAPRRTPGLSYERDKENFDRIDAVSYTLAHDDGCHLSDLHSADVVLVGVSRVCKSVTCFYLAYRGVCAANVPLVPECPPPTQLLAMPKEKVIGLTANLNRIRSVREVRKKLVGNAPIDYYVDRMEIGKELRYAQSLMEEHGWRHIDVSYMAVEEVAKEVMTLIGR